MYIHKEGHRISLLAIVLAILFIVGMALFSESWGFIQTILTVCIIVLVFFVIRFFRIPKRVHFHDENMVLCPADGTVVALEPVFEKEILQEECMQISIFMSPNNVHVNLFPVSGTVSYMKYHPGKHLVANHPKSSFLNEHTTICIETPQNDKVVVRQIAGAVARRIVCYAKEGQEVKQNDELGFIKFGSRVDILIPMKSTISVSLNDKVKGGITALAHLNHAPACSDTNPL